VWVVPRSLVKPEAFEFKKGPFLSTDFGPRPKTKLWGSSSPLKKLKRKKWGKDFQDHQEKGSGRKAGVARGKSFASWVT